MCGILFSKDSKNSTDTAVFKEALMKQRWRGPDALGVSKEDFGVHLGHVRLSILDVSDISNQPMASKCQRYKIIFNGEIYNHLEIREKLNLKCQTQSDTETLLEGFCDQGVKIFDLLDGMFSVVIFDVLAGDWWAARDRYGIKPLFSYSLNGHTIISSETVSIRKLVECNICDESIREWRLIRRPIPGHTFFEQIDEILPGSVIRNGKVLCRLGITDSDAQSEYDQRELEELIRCSVKQHELSHVDNVCLLSGGIDSSLITALSTSNKAYTVGLSENNEISEARHTAEMLSATLVEVRVDPDELFDSWRRLIKLRGEPLSVPNEGLIFLVCNAMKKSEKVVLTGEGADEIFFGYDRIYRKACSTKRLSFDDFFDSYAYAKRDQCTARLDQYVRDLMHNKSSIEFVEDFFLQVHMTGLLRRMDMASMAASKEARVPFVTKALIEYMFRRSSKTKINSEASKIPLREMCISLGLMGPIHRKKIGFSSTIAGVTSRYEEYERFRNFNMEALGW